MLFLHPLFRIGATLEIEWLNRLSILAVVMIFGLAALIGAAVCVSHELRVVFRTGVQTCSVSADQRFVLVGTGHGKIVVLDANSGERLRTFEHRIPTTSWSAWRQRLVLHPVIAESAFKQFLAQRRLAKRNPARSDAYSSRLLIGVVDSAISPDGTWAVTAATDENRLSWWDFPSGQRRPLLPGHAAAVTACAISPDARRIASGASDGTTLLMHVGENQNDHTLHKRHALAVSACEFSPSSEFLASASHDGTIVISACATGDEVCWYDFGRPVRCVSWSPTECQLAVGDSDGTIHLVQIHNVNVHQPVVQPSTDEPNSPQTLL
jgi:WD40 repeat protein